MDVELMLKKPWMQNILRGSGLPWLNLLQWLLGS